MIKNRDLIPALVVLTVLTVDLQTRQTMILCSFEGYIFRETFEKLEHKRGASIVIMTLEPISNI